MSPALDVARIGNFAIANGHFFRGDLLPLDGTISFFYADNFLWFLQIFCPVETSGEYGMAIYIDFVCYSFKSLHVPTLLSPYCEEVVEKLHENAKRTTSSAIFKVQNVSQHGRPLVLKLS